MTPFNITEAVLPGSAGVYQGGPEEGFESRPRTNLLRAPLHTQPHEFEIRHPGQEIESLSSFKAQLKTFFLLYQTAFYSVSPWEFHSLWICVSFVVKRR